MIQAQSQNNEIRQFCSKVGNEVRDKVCEKVRYEVEDEVLWKVEVGFKAKNKVRRKLFK